MTEHCSRCGLSAVLARDTAANGSVQVFWWCAHCARVSDPRRPFVTKAEALRLIHGAPLDTLPVIERYPRNDLPKCEYFGCQSRQTEYHHFAPRYLFEDAENWPGAYLCTEHHRQWHTVVTPHMSRRKSAPKVEVA